MEFEWDEAKRQHNLNKHGIDFKDVPEVFESPVSIALDLRREYGEERWILVGLLRTSLVLVVFAERGEESIWIISARRMKKNEEEKITKGRNRF